MNAINVIYPYKYLEMWVFDDEKVGLVQEPFVSGADDIIDKYVEQYDDATAGFTLLFSAEPFPGYQVKLEWLRADLSGNWYKDSNLQMEGWLCPALLKYFEGPPLEIFAQFKERKG